MDSGIGLFCGFWIHDAIYLPHSVWLHVELELFVIGPQTVGASTIITSHWHKRKSRKESLYNWEGPCDSLKRKKYIHFDLLWLLHLNSDSNLRSGWDNSQSHPKTKSRCGFGSTPITWPLSIRHTSTIISPILLINQHERKVGTIKF